MLLGVDDAVRDVVAGALAALPMAQDRVVATLRMAMMTGWAPAPDQPKPAQRGSGVVSLAEVLRDGEGG